MLYYQSVPVCVLGVGGKGGGRVIVGWEGGAAAAIQLNN